MLKPKNRSQITQNQNSALFCRHNTNLFQGFSNIQSPMKSAFYDKNKASSRQNLSPFKKYATGTNISRTKNKSKSPVLQTYNTSTVNKSPQKNYLMDKNNLINRSKKVSPFRRQSSYVVQNQYYQDPCYINSEIEPQYQPQNERLSFTNLIKKGSNLSNPDKSVQSVYPQFQQQVVTSKLGLSSKRNYLQSDRSNNGGSYSNKGETNLFGKLAAMLQSNRSTQNTNTNQNMKKNYQTLNQNNFNDFYSSTKNFYEGQYIFPQSCKNQREINRSPSKRNFNYQTCNNMYLNNVTTVESIQTPEQCQFINQNKVMSNMNYDYQKMTKNSEYQKFTKVRSIQKNPNIKSPNKITLSNGGKKCFTSSKKVVQQNKLQTHKILSFNQNNKNESNQLPKQSNQKQSSQNKLHIKQSIKPENLIDFHLNNSFGTSVKKGTSQNQDKSLISDRNNNELNSNNVKINPFEQILINFSGAQNEIQQIQKPKIEESMYEEQDSDFLTIKMMLNKDDKGTIPQRQSTFAKRNNEQVNISLQENDSLNMNPCL